MESLCRYRLEAAGAGGWSSRMAWWRIVGDALVGAGREWLLAGARSIGTGPWSPISIGWDLRLAVRSIRRTPVVAGIAVLTLGLGIGAITTTFTVVDGVVLEPLPFEDPDRIVSVWPVANFNTAMVREVAEAVPALDAIAGISTWTAVLSGQGDPVEIDVGRVSPAFFRILGADPELGRPLALGDDLPDNSAVVVLSHPLWSTRFGSDPNIVGRAIQLSMDSLDVHTVVGVMNRAFRPPFEADAWAPLVDDRSLSVVSDPTWFVNDRIARLAPGSTVAQASDQVRALAERLAPSVPNQFEIEQVAAANVVPLKDDLLRDADTALWALLGAVGLVLLIACANVANLLLARGEARQQTLAVRAALGANRASLVRLLLSEALVLGVAGGVLGVLMAVALTDAVVALAPPQVPRIQTVGVDWGVLTFALCVTLGATVVSGLWPAWRTSRQELVAGLGGSSRGAARLGSSRTVSQVLIAAEVALAVIVTLGSGLMLRSLDRLLSVEIGFEPAGVLAFRPNPLGSGRSGVDDFRQFYRTLMEELEAAPGVDGVGGVQILTGTRENWSFPTYPSGYEIPESGALPDVNFRAVLPGYFEALHIPLVRGRTIQAADRADAEPVVVVNEAFVREFWPGEDGLGNTLSVFGTENDRLRVVGVVGDIRQHALSQDPRPELYVPYMSWPWEMSAWIFVRTAVPQALRADIRRIVDRVDPNVPVSGVEDLDVVLARSAAETRFFTVLLSSFGGLGLLLGAIGIYGVTAYSVARRRSEFGVRLALGSTRRGIVASALGRGIAPILVGAAGGVVLGISGARVLRSYLYQIEPFDPLTLAGVTLALSLVATVALTVPAWRAGRVNPTEVLTPG